MDHLNVFNLYKLNKLFLNKNNSSEITNNFSKQIFNSARASIYHHIINRKVLFKPIKWCFYWRFQLPC